MCYESTEQMIETIINDSLPNENKCMTCDYPIKNANVETPNCVSEITYKDNIYDYITTCDECNCSLRSCKCDNKCDNKILNIDLSQKNNTINDYSLKYKNPIVYFEDRYYKKYQNVKQSSEITANYNTNLCEQIKTYIDKNNDIENKDTNNNCTDIIKYDRTIKKTGKSVNIDFTDEMIDLVINKKININIHINVNSN